jgi:hypothetical protein
VKTPFSSLLAHDSCNSLTFAFIFIVVIEWIAKTLHTHPYGAFTLNVKSMLNENLGGILGGT